MKIAVLRIDLEFSKYPSPATHPGTLGGLIASNDKKEKR